MTVKSHRLRGPRFALLFAAALLALVALAPRGRAAIPPAERLLPADTLLVISTPDCARLQVVYGKMPQVQMWNDPAMKPFRDKFMLKWKEEFVVPLERDLGVKFDEFTGLLQGQLTLAMTAEGWPGQQGAEPAFLLLLDARDKREQLKQHLAALRKKWVEDGKPIKTEKIREVEFAVVPLSTNEVPKTLTQFFPQHQQIQELGREPATESPRKTELVIGQFESLLIVGSSLKAVEKVVARLTGGAVPALAEEAAFEASRLAMFRDAPLYGWFNGRLLFDALARLPAEESNPQAPSPLPVLTLRRLLTASGLAGVKSAAFAARDLPEGIVFETFLGAPESSRQGVLKIFATEAKDARPPVFVPADAVKFQRYRIDGQKAVAVLENMLSELSLFNTWDFLLTSGNEAAQLGDPNYDLRKDLIANLGDDLIAYEKVPSGSSPAEMNSPPSLVLIGSPNAERLLAGLKGVLVIFSPDATSPKEREFLGRKILSISLPPMPWGNTTSRTRTLHYAASGGYVAFTTQAAMLEEFLRSNEGQPRALREMPGLLEAAQHAGGLSTGWFGFENLRERMRLDFAAYQKGAATPRASSSGLNPLTSAIPIAGPERSLKEWMDFSLLPAFDNVGKYFHFAVHAGSANVDGLTLRWFYPAPPPSGK
ncbi:MAG: hypothetical protein IH623_21380 [Verrucomicrobia bacterium]|nr:hypothetical protein [Verrucomicrobiota bacterium]